MPCLQVFARSVSCPRVWAAFRLTVCVLRPLWVTACCPVGRKKVWRRQCLLLQPVAIATAHSCATILTLIATRHVTAPFFRPHFCDVFQVAGEGHYYFTLPHSLLVISGKIFFKKSDFLTFRLQKCILPFCLYLQTKVSSQFVSDSIIL